MELTTAEIKKILGNRAKDIIASSLNMKFDKSGKTSCVLHQEDTPSMSWDARGHNFKCFGCTGTLDIFKLYTDFNNLSFIEAKNEVLKLIGENPKEYTRHNVKAKKEPSKPNSTWEELDADIINVMAKRGIKKETLEAWNVKKQVVNGESWIKFFYKDENGKMPYANRRRNLEPCPSNQKALPCGTNLKAILWGMWHIDITKPLIITEGQPDAMIIYQAGYKNVVSVPAGASNLSWIENCYEWLSNFTEIYIYGDNDDAGVKMVENVRDRLGGDRVRAIQHKHKDANDVYLKDGAETIINDIQEAFNQVPEGLTNISQESYEFESSGEVEGIPTGFNGLDYELEYLKREEVSLLFGRTSEGKSTIVSQIICNSIQAERPVFLYSGEMGDKKVKRWLYKQACGMDDKYCNFITKKIGGFNKAKREIKPEVVKAIDKWVGNYFITLDKKSVSVRKELEALFKTMKLAIQKYGCKLLIIDNMMSAISETTEHYFNQSNFMAMCVEFATKNGCHVMVVAHPNKSTDEGDRLKKTSVSGSGNIINMADIVIGVEKFTDEMIYEFPESEKRHGCMRLLKNREEGTTKEFSYKFNSTNKRLTEYVNIGTYKGFDNEPFYNWEKYLEKPKFDLENPF